MRSVDVGPALAAGPSHGGYAHRDGPPAGGGPAEPMGGSALKPPPAAVRGEKAFIRVDRLLACLDGWLARWLPPALNPLAQAGTAANFALVVAVLTGVALLIWYSPSVQFAYGSLEAIHGRTLGGWVRGLHRYSSDLAMLLLVVHAGRVFFARKFGGARWLPWVSGVAMLALVWLIGWTGYWLVWDQPAQQVAVSSMRLLDGLPIFGEPLARLYVSDRTVPSLLFFVVFFLHMLLPLAIAIGLAVHLARVTRARLMPRRALSLGLLAALALAAWLFPAPLDAPARMAEKAAGFTVDSWYLSPLALGLRFQEGGLWFALLGGALLAALVPWLLGKKRLPETFQARVTQARCHACTQCVQDCPFDAISMVARTDGKNFPSQAQVDPARCVGCGVCAGSCDSEGISMTWFDTRVQEARLEQEIETAVAADGANWIAFVAADIHARLPQLRGYQAHVVPTASWVRPKFVERLYARGVRGVLIVRDAAAEAWARDGNAWVAARLAGERKPVLRRERAAGGAWSVVDFDPSRPDELLRAAEEFRATTRSGVRQPRAPRPALLAAAAGVVAITVLAAVGPGRIRVTNPASPAPEFVFSFKALGERVEGAALDPAVEAAKPVHMRGRTTQKPHRAPVVVKLTIDGVSEEKSFAAKGFGHDGPAVGEWRRALSPGKHQIRVEVSTGGTAKPMQWEGILSAETRRLHVLSFEPQAGFFVE